MPSPKATNKGPAKLSERQIRKIWPDIKAPVLAERLRSLRPQGRWAAAGNQIVGCCPYHDETTPSFRIYVDRGYAKCFGCDKYITNPLQVWAKVRGCSITDALLEFRQLFGLKSIPASANSQIAAWDRNQLLKRRIMEVCHSELLAALADPTDPTYTTAHSAAKYLTQTRKIPADALPALPIIGVMPPAARVTEILRQEALKENERRKTEALTTGETYVPFDSLESAARDYLQAAAGWVGSLVFRLDTAPDAIGRLKLRKPYASSSAVTQLPDPFEEGSGFYGLGWGMYSPLLGAQQKYSWPYVVEGEFDALSIMARQVQAGGPGFLTVAAGGTYGSEHIDDLADIGFNEVYLFSDAPGPKKGELLLKQWLPSIKRLRAKLFVGWDQFPGSGDPDEAVVTHGLGAVQKVLLDVKNKALYQNPPDWVFEQAQPELDAVDPEDGRYRIEIASSWGQLLKNSVDLDLFVQSCADVYGVQGALLKREITAKEEDEAAFILRVADVLGGIFYVLGQRSFDSDRRLYLWYREQQKIVQVSLADDGSIERELGTALGPTYQLFQERIGIPPFLENRSSLKKKTQEYAWYLRQALLIMAQVAPDYNSAPHKGQGLHVIRGKDGAPPTLYLVNSKDVYWGTFDENDLLSWKKLDGPSHNGIIFDINTGHTFDKPWLPWVTSVEDLEKATQIDLQDCWDKLHHALDAGWRYRNHQISTDFLTGHLLATTVASAFRRQIFCAFHADTSSGKSRMVMGLIGGNDFPRIHLIAATTSIPQCTPAAIRQGMNNKTRALCLDEFEDDGSGDRKSRNVAEMLEMFRNLTGENNSYQMGSRFNEPVTYNLNFFIFTASINKARKVQDANRMVTIFLERQAGRVDPQLVLLNEFGADGIEKLKQDLSLGLLPKIAQLQRLFDEVEAEYSKPGTRPSYIDTRTFETLFPTITVMKLLGKDYPQFVSDFCLANQESFAISAAHTDSMDLFNWLSQSPMLVHRDDGGNKDKASLLQMLATPDTRADINRCGSGLYWDEDSKLLVVSWTTAIQTVLSGHTRYGRETNVHNLRELANRAPHAIKADELENSPALARLKAQGLGGVPVTSLTGYRMLHILESMAGTPSTQEVPKKQAGAHLASVRTGVFYGGDVSA